MTREEFEKILDDFVSFVSSKKRMSFWRKKEAKHVWTSHPEKHAQDLLHTFLEGRFWGRVSVLEEISSGAGRIDLYVQLYGGLSLILELKMCGHGYSSTYAAEGEEQLLHYMRNRHSHLGYLVVFDARADDFGRPLVKDTGLDTVITKFIEMSPTVKARKGGQ